jgi:hypothetical protein
MKTSMKCSLPRLALALLLLPSFVAISQTISPVSIPAVSAQTVVPALVGYSGTALNAQGSPLSGEVSMTFLIFKDQTGGEPFFTETQSVALDATGHYKVNLGATLSSGLPAGLFSTGESRWLEVQIAGQPAQPRALLVSVPYAMQAADASTLGGLPASAYALAGQVFKSTIAPAGVTPDAASNVTTTGGTAGYVPEFNGAATIVDSPIFVLDGNVTLGTTAAPSALTVNGAVTVTGDSTYEGSLVMPPIGVATAKGFFASQFIKIESSAWNSSTGSAVTPRFQLQVVPTGNNTANPGATLDLYASAGTAKPAATGFSFNTDGTLNFAPGQTFPASTFTGAIADTAAVAGGNAIAATNTAVLGTGVSGTGAGPGGYGVTGTANGDGNTGFTPVGVLGYSVPGYGVSALTESGIALFSEAKTTGQAGYFTSAFSGPMNGEVVAPTDTASVAIYNTGANVNSIGNYNNANPQGLYVESDGSNATGILGTVQNEYGIGIWGVLGSGSGVANEQRGYINGAGVWGDSVEGFDGSPGFFGVVGTTDDNTAGYFVNNGTDYSTITVTNFATGGVTGLFRTLQASTSDGTCGFGDKGNLTCTGQVKTLATTSKSRVVETYAMQSPENWMEDFGSAALTNGVATVTIDPTFAETANTGAEYHVFLTPNGDSKGLYVTAKGASTFEVHESSGGASTLRFDYRIVARRVGHESERLVDVTDRFHKETAATTKQFQEAHAHPDALHTTRPAAPKPASPRIPHVQSPVQPTSTTPPPKVADLR